MTSQTFNLDLIPQGVPPIVHVSQYDKGQTWNIHLFENGVVFPVPSGTSAAVQGTKPDNTGFQYPAVISVGDNVVTFTVEQQMTVLGGQFECELVLVNGENQVATINFILDVEPTTLDDDTVISETQLPLIEQAAELGAVINNYATQIHADAETASTAATAATSAAESTAADSATATQAADDAQASQTAAASSASNAATSETNAAASATAAASSASSAAQEATNAAVSAAAAQAAIATDMTGATASTAGAHGLVPAPAAGDDTKFLGGDGTWKAVPAALSGLTDVVLTNPADGQLLRYDATTQKWKNFTPSLLSGVAKQIGTLDGVPVFKLVKKANAPITDLGVTFDEILELNVLVRGSASNQWRPLPWLYVYDANGTDTYGDAAWAGGVTVSSGGTVFWQTGDVVSAVDRCIVTVVYTKQSNG